MNSSNLEQLVLKGLMTVVTVIAFLITTMMLQLCSERRDETGICLID